MLKLPVGFWLIIFETFMKLNKSGVNDQERMLGNKLIRTQIVECRT
jgi:hypothetical protein